MLHCTIRMVNSCVKKPEIIIESHIPYIPAELSSLANVVRLAPEDITPKAVRNADALIVRTRTRCNANLLDGSNVRFIATATIGTDHIDKEYCEKKGIKVVSAPGCNAPAVAQYVWASILSLCPNVRGLTIGIVGLGHVGSIVADWGRRLGVRILACDPPRRHGLGEGICGWDSLCPYEAGDEPFVSLGQIAAEADIITFHTPLTISGPETTFHIADDAFFDSLRRKPIIVNAARGPIFDTEAVLRAFAASKISGVIIDCWEGEPCLSGDLLSLADIATPHIAGYSIEGKQRASSTVISAALNFFNIESEGILLAENPITCCEDCISTSKCANVVAPELFARAILDSYNPLDDTAMLKDEFTPEKFETLRNNYSLRRELNIGTLNSAVI